jgi:hypothetical protein
MTVDHYTLWEGGDPSVVDPDRHRPFLDAVCAFVGVKPVPTEYHPAISGVAGLSEIGAPRKGGAAQLRFSPRPGQRRRVRVLIESGP